MNQMSRKNRMTLLLAGYHQKESEFGNDFIKYYARSYPIKDSIFFYHVKSPVIHEDNKMMRDVYYELEDIIISVNPNMIIDIHQGYKVGKVEVNFELFYGDLKRSVRLNHIRQFDANPEKKAIDYTMLDKERIKIIEQFRIPYIAVEAMLKCSRITEPWPVVKKDADYELALLSTANLVNVLHSIKW